MTAVQPSETQRLRDLLNEAHDRWQQCLDYIEKIQRDGVARAEYERGYNDAMDKQRRDAAVNLEASVPPTDAGSTRYLTVAECEAFGPPGSPDEVTPVAFDADGRNVRSVLIYTTHISGSREARERKHGSPTYARLVHAADKRALTAA